MMWNEIPFHHQNGIIRKYVVVVTETNTGDGFEETSQTESIVLNSLHPFYTYKVHIAAYTTDQGPFSPPVNFTMDEDVPSSSPTNFSSLVISPREVWLWWLPPPLAGQNGVITSYTVIVTNAQNGQEWTYVTEVTSLNLSSLSPFTEYKSKVAANTSIGMGPTTTSIAFLTPEDVPSSPPDDLTGEALSSTSIMLSWQPPIPEMQNGIIRLYSVTVLETNTGNTFNSTTAYTNLTISSLHPFYTYHCSVAAVTIGIGHFSDIKEIQTLPDVPSSYPGSVMAAANGSSSLVVIWLDIPFHEANGIIWYYAINITVLDSSENIYEETDETTLELSELHPFYTYIISVAGFTIGYGPFSPEVSLTLPQDAPSGPPQDLAVHSITSSSLQLSWELPNPEERNGLVQSYNIVVFEIDTNTTKSMYQDFQHHSILVNDLHPYYHYELSVAAFTVALGPYASTTIQTKQDVPSSPPNDVTVTIQSSSVVLITWSAPDKSHQNGVIQHYVLSLFEEETGWLREEFSSGTNITIADLHPSFAYTMNISAVTIGVGAKLTLSFQMPEDVPAAPPANSRVEAIGPRSILVSWDPPPLLTQNGLIVFYTLILTHNVSGQEETYNSTSTSLILSGLSPYTWYKCAVAANTAIGIGPFSGSITIQTPQDVPSGPPLQLMASDIQSTSFDLSWFPPEEEARNGIIESYVVVCHVINNGSWHTFSTSLTTLPLNMLHPYYQYNCSIAAATIVGVGPFTETLLVTTLEDVPQLPPESLVVIPTSERTLLVSWNELQEDQANGVVRHYVVKVFVTESAENFEYTSQDTHLMINNTHPYYTYSVSVSAYTIGHGPYSDEVTVVTPQEAPSGPPENLTVVLITSKSIQLSWDPPLPDQQNGIIQSYSIVVFENYSNTTFSSYHEYPNHTIVINNLHPYYVYRVSVAANTVGQGPFAVLVALTEQDAPSAAPRDLVIDVLSSRSVHLQWNPPEQENQNGVIQFYSIAVTGLDNTLIETYTTNVTLLTLSTLHPAYTYVIEIAAVTISFGPVINTTLTMDEDVPSSSPESLTSHNLTSTSIKLKWNPPSQESQNGLIKNYTVLCANNNLTTNATYITHQTHLDLLDLNSFSVYECAVAASTVVGLGPFTTWLTFQTDEDVPSSPPANVSAVALNSNSISVSWDALPADLANGVIRKYTVNVTVSESQEKWTIETLHTTVTLSELHPYYTFTIQVAAHTIGLGPFSHQQTVKTLQDVPSGPPQQIFATSITATAILLSWMPPLPELQNGVVRFYVVTVFEADTNSLIQIYDHHNDTSIFLTNLHPFYLYQISVSAVTINVGPLGTVNASTLEAAPSGAPRNFVVVELNSTSIHITWSAPEPSLQNGLIRGYTIKSTEIETQKETMHSVGVTTETIIDQLHPFYHYKLSVAALTIALGPFSNLTTLQLSESTPGIAPQEFNVEITNETSLGAYFSWQTIPQEFANGVLLGYKLICTTENGTEILSATSTGASIRATNAFVSSDHYTCLLCGFTSVGNGPKAVTHISTYPDSPIGPPKNVMAFAGTTLIQLQWEGPFDPKGLISGYIILYQLMWTNTSLTSPRPLVTVSTGALETEVILRPLLENSLYRIVVYGETNSSTGPGSKELRVSTKPHAANTPVDFKCFPQDSHTLACQWTPPVNIDIAFYVLSYKLADGYDYHVGYGDILETANLTQTAQSFTMNGLQAYTGYVVELDMHAYNYSTKPSEVESYTTSAVSITLPEVPDASIEHLRAENISETAVQIYWVPPARIHWKGIVFYHIVLSNLGPNAAEVSKSHQAISNVSVTFQPQANNPDPSLASEPLLSENYRLEDLEENYQYSIVVTIANSAGAGTPSQPVIQTMPESVPSGPPTNINLFSANSTSMTVSWDPPNPEDANGIITGYTLHYKRRNAENASENDIEPDKLQFTIYDLLPYEHVSIAIAARNSKGEGPFSPEVTYHTQEALPSAPQSLEAMQENTTTVTLSWNPPQHPNGELLGYQVLYTLNQSSGDKVTNDASGQIALPMSDNPVAVVADLSEGLLYKFEVSAWNRAGYGESISTTLQLEITERENDPFLETSTIITAIIFGCVILLLITLIGVVIYLIIVRRRKKIQDERRTSDESRGLEISSELTKEEERKQLDTVMENKGYFEEEIKESPLSDNDSVL